MYNKARDTERLKVWFDTLFPVGALPDGSVTRLGYTAEEDRMHSLFTEIAKDIGFDIYTDEVGNSFAANSMNEPYILIGSHLDSVVQGGRYDGVAGVLGGLLVMTLIREAGLDIPVRVAAFRCEESSNFGCATMGSGLITGALSAEKAAIFKNREGKTFADVMQERGHSLNPQKIRGLAAYYEIHIEQGKVLEESGERLGIVTGIAGPRRFSLSVKGLAEHSGATPMNLREDALCAAAEIILAIEKIGRQEPDSVATVGVIHNTPNALNVIPGAVELGVDLRSIRAGSLDNMEEALRDAVREVCDKRGIAVEIKATSGTSPVELSPNLIKALSAAGQRLDIPCRMMPSGAGHDAMEFPPLCDTAMVFIPCEGGISHNGLEKASLDDLRDGAYLIFEAIRGV